MFVIVLHANVYLMNDSQINLQPLVNKQKIGIYFDN